MTINTALIDLIGATLSLIATLLYIPQSILAWPISLCAITLNAILFFHLGIYGDFSLEIIYGVLCIYGWYQWSMLDEKGMQSLVVRRVPRQLIVPLLSATTIAALACYYVLTVLGSTIAWLDATTTMFSILGQWLTARKYIECWFVWFTVDFIYIFLYTIKGIPFHSLLVILYCFIAIIGFITWRKKMIEQSSLKLCQVS